MRKIESVTNQLGGYTKYRSLILSLSLFSLLVISIMFLSLYVSNQLEKDTKVINTAFEQTSLLNEIVSGLYIINSQYNVGQASSFTQKRLQEVVNLIDRRMIAFKNGGELPVVSIGTFNELDVVNVDTLNENLQTQMEAIWPLWNEYKRRVLPALEFKGRKSSQKKKFDRYQFYGSVLHKQGAISGLNRLNLNVKADRFALQLQQESDKRSDFLGLVQIIGIAITGFSLALILFFIVRQLRRSDSDLDSAREESKGILSTIQEGLFLIHKDKNIGSEYSSELENILGTQDIAGRNILDVLGDIVSEKDIKNINSFVNSLFNPKVVASLMMDLNPLKELRAKITNASGTIEEKYLNFNFYRVIKKGVISDILVSSKDITDKILLQKKLEVTETKNEEQVKTLISLMNINPSTLQLFLNNGTSLLSQINTILKNQIEGEDDFYKKINAIFIRIHTIKGEASAINLKVIAENAHNFETALEKLKNINEIDGINFLPLAVKLKKLMSYMDSISQLAKKIYGVDRKNIGQQANQKSNADWSHLKNLTKEVASQYDKKAELVICGLSEITLNEELKTYLNSIFIHLINNSLVHGIELPDERERMSKPSVGRIDIRAVELSSGALEVIVRDDGKGIDLDKVAQQLVAKGMATQDEVRNWPRKEIYKRILLPGFSTHDIDINAGRGVGLGAIRHTIKRIGGNLKVKQSVNHYCQFSIHLPPSSI
ncbi:MAG: two-component system chemotaxis sensor kinase CheA [Candidatus Endobugula sp.]|jgi:two-component system chemotaxis sensor kinase CheA